uniref:Integrase catalytic domain-containing protein n=1 Tax=Oryzias sinensis TaxID=183150 RepID=A0A8C7XNK1_9TELE
MGKLIIRPYLGAPCLCQHISVLRSSPGVTLLVWRAMGESTEPLTYFAEGFSGRRWKRMFGNTSRHAPPVPGLKRPPRPRRGYSILSPRLTDPGPIWLWTLSPGYPPSNGNTVILTVIDRFSKMAHFIPLPQLPTATDTADIMVNHVFRHHGIPMDIVSDRGPQFISQVWKAFCTALGATVSLTSGYHPQSNGQAERANQELEAALRCLAAQNQQDWSLHLVWIEYAHNTHPSSATGLSPFEAALGYSPPLFPSQEQDLAVPSVQHHIRRCRRIWAQAKAALLRTKESNCRIANRHRVVGPEYQPG